MTYQKLYEMWGFCVLIKSNFLISFSNVGQFSSRCWSSYQQHIVSEMFCWKGSQTKANLYLIQFE